MSTYAQQSLTAVTATVCSLMGVPLPSLAEPGTFADVVTAAQRMERMLIYAPDALGWQLFQHHPDALAAVKHCAPIAVKLLSEQPAKTPVCFASMFTGAKPAAHGITKYERFELECDTLFDALTRAGKRVAIVAVKDSSIDLIFRGRGIDYFSEQYDPQVTHRTLELVAARGHDFILAYHQQYDDLLHQTAPESEECLLAFRAHVAAFSRLCAATAEHWGDAPYAVAFTPDHGAHFDETLGVGTHGDDCPADMELLHLWGIHGS